VIRSLTGSVLDPGRASCPGETLPYGRADQYGTGMTETPRAAWTTPSLDVVTDADATADSVAPVRNGTSIIVGS